MLGFMLIQQKDSHASILVFSFPMWFRCSWYNAFSCSLHALLFFCLSLQCCLDCNLISEWSVWLQVLLYISFGHWLAMGYEPWQHALCAGYLCFYSYFFCSVILSMLLYLVFTLVNILLANAIGHNAVFWGASFLGNCIESLTWNYSCFFHCKA